MKLGIIGLPGSGKTTVFRALTGGLEQQSTKGRQEPGLGTVKVDDPRLEFLENLHQAKKTTPVYVEYLDIAGLTGEGEPGREIGDRALSHIRPVDALVHCVRYFDSPALGPPEALRDLDRVEEEMLLSDLAQVEKRLERVDREVAKGRKELAEEQALLREARAALEEGKPLRLYPPAYESDLLRGYAFLTAKPELLLVNAGEERSKDQILPLLEAIRTHIGDQPFTAVDWLYADAEAEIARLDEKDAKDFLEEMGIDESAKQRIIRTSFDLLNLIVFFTAGEKEVRAWPLRRGSSALDAAGTVHTDMQKGFIRAEVVAFDDLKETGSMQEAQKKGKVRLEGKTYQAQDGDIILFRFNI